MHLSSLIENRGQHPRIAATVQNGNDSQRFFIWRVRDYIIEYHLESEGPSRQVWTGVALVRETMRSA